MSLDFSTDSPLEIFDVTGSPKLLSQQNFQCSFNCVDWSDTDLIAAGADEGYIVIAQPQSLHGAQMLKLTDADLSVIKFSDESESAIAVGTTDGQVMILDQSGQVVYNAQLKLNQNPHASRVIKVAWNPRVPRVFCSLDASGVAIVWDLKKRGAVSQFKCASGVDVVFSNEVATTLYVLTLGGVEVWDLRTKSCLKQFALPEGRQIYQQEGLQQVLNVRTRTLTYSYSLQDYQLVGQQQLGEVFSLVFPNRFASQEEGKLVVQNLPIVINKAPVLFNVKLLRGEVLEENDDETIQLVHRPLLMSRKNNFRFVQGQQLMCQHIKDNQQLVETVQRVLSAPQLEQACQALVDKLALSKEQLMEQIVGERVERFDANQIGEFDQGIAHQYLVQQDFDSLMRYLAHHQRFDMLFFAAMQFQLKVPQELVEQFKESQQELAQEFQLFDLLASKKVQPDNTDYKDCLRIAAAQRQPLLPVVQECIKQQTEDHVNMLLYADRREEAVMDVLKKTKLSMEQKLSLGILLWQKGLRYPEKDLEVLVQVVAAQGQQELTLQLKEKLGLKEKAPMTVVQQPTQPRELPLKPANLVTNQVKQDFFSPSTSFQPAAAPHVAHVAPPRSDFFAPQPVAPKNDFFTPQPPQPQPISMAPPKNDFFAPVHQQPVQQQPISAQPVPKPAKNELFAVDLLQPPQPPNQFGQPNQFNQPNQFAQQNPFPPPQPFQPFQRSPPSNDRLLHPTQPVSIPMPEKSAFHSRGPELVAVAPPSVNGQTGNGLIKVQQTTAPAKQLVKKPVQQLDTQLKHLELVQSVEIKTELAQQFLQIIQQYSQVDQFQFKKNAAKLADFLVWVSDSEEQKLFSPEAVQVLCSVAQLFQRDVRSVSAELQEFAKKSDELLVWAGALRIMANALAK